MLRPRGCRRCQGDLFAETVYAHGTREIQMVCLQCGRVDGAGPRVATAEDLQQLRRRAS